MNEYIQRVSAAYFKTHSLAQHQLDSYSDFLKYKIPSVIMGTNVEYTKHENRYVLTFDNVHVQIPLWTDNCGIEKQIFPQDCRIRNLNYWSAIKVEICQHLLTNDNRIKDTKRYSEITLGMVPVMVYSEFCNLYHYDPQTRHKKYGECILDPGGYFIINGSEKVLVSQDRMAHNEIFVFKEKLSKTQKNRWSHYAQVTSFSEQFEPNITTTKVLYEFSGRMYMSLPGIKDDFIPLPIVFLAYNVDATEMKKLISNDPKILKLLDPSTTISVLKTQNDALLYLSGYCQANTREKRLNAIKRILYTKMFQGVNLEIKKYYLAHIVYQLLSTIAGNRGLDDRDHQGKKRVESAGALTVNLFKSIWKKIIRTAKKDLEKKNVNPDIIFADKITNMLRTSFATGNWSVQKTQKTARVGISQLLNRMNYIATLSSLRRIVTPTYKNNKIVKARYLHGSHFYYICPAETPEGGSTGLIKNMSLLGGLSIESSPETILEWLTLFNVTLLGTTTTVFFEKGQIKILLNGTWVGLIDNSQAFDLLDKLKTLRRNQKIHKHVSICMKHDGIMIYTDSGRMIAPFFIVHTNTQEIRIEPFNTWDDLLEKHIIEFLDVSELETLYVSAEPWNLEPGTSHALIHPCFLLGVSASTIPFPDTNQSPRNLFQSSMGKQALGIYCTNVSKRFDTTSHVLNYPQKPIVNTIPMRLLECERVPNGQNLIVAIACYTGYNQEDSLIINKSAIERGLLRTTCYTTTVEHNKKHGNTSNVICKPDPSELKETRYSKDYHNLDSDGVPKEGTPLAKGDIVIGKKSVTMDYVRDASVIVSPNGMVHGSVKLSNEKYIVDYGSVVVDKTIFTTNNDGHKTVKVRCRQSRIPQIGDKCASRSAQKGVIGLILPEVDMPFSHTGMTPDLIINPQAIPSRMTISQILETVLGKACAMAGEYGDCTPCNPEYQAKTIIQKLHEHGFQGYGDERLICGMTGDMLKCNIFMGPTYYQRLKHMVDDKIHARSSDGARELISHQPVEGRKRGGGFKMGEWETWACSSHGSSRFIIDRLVNNSDGYTMYICDDCGNTAIANLNNNTYECKRCDQNINISKIQVPYAFKLLQQELMATGIGVWYQV